MDDKAILEEMILELGLEYDTVDIVLGREHTYFEGDTIYQLDLTGLNIEYIPDIIAQLESLQILDLSHNRITEFTPFLLDMTNLQELYLYANPFEQIPLSLEPIFDIIEVEYYKIPRVSEKVNSKQKTTRFFVRVASEEEKSKVEILLAAYRERRCCKMTARFEEKFCSVCGRSIPDQIVN